MSCLVLFLCVVNCLVESFAIQVLVLLTYFACFLAIYSITVVVYHHCIASGSKSKGKENQKGAVNFSQPSSHY